jgi:Zn-dependent protease with chaperone function
MQALIGYGMHKISIYGADMKGRIKALVYLLLLTQLSVSVWEVLGSYLVLKSVDRIGYPRGSFIYEAAKDDPEFVKSQREALRKEIRKHRREVQYILFCIGLATMVLQKKVRKKILRFYSTKTRAVSAEKMLLFSFVLLFLLAQHFIYKKSSFIHKLDLLEIRSWVQAAEAILVASLLSVYLTTKGLRVFGSKLIVAVYISVVIQKVYNSLSVHDVDLERYKKVSAEKFPEEIQELLANAGLLESIYTSRKRKDQINAALVGMGEKKRIEIRGDAEALGEREANAIVLHEIGHALDHSLLKRRIADNTVLIVEMLILVLLYTRSVKMLGCSYLSREGSFVLLALLYCLSARVWLLMVPKMVSQCTEFSADSVARSHGYGRDLASALYKLCVSNAVLMNPFFLSNAITSLHPSVYLRIRNATVP